MTAPRSDPSPTARTSTYVSPLITVVTTCKGRLHHLRRSLPLLASQPGLHCIVVDYACPGGAGDWVAQNFPGVQVVRAGATDAFSISKARNFGGMQVTTPWIAFVDADTLVDAGFAHDLAAILRDGHFFVADPCPHELTGLVVCTRSDFIAVGGYDECFAGWGCEDRDFYLRLERHGITRSPFPAHAIAVIAHDDTQRVQYHAVADRFLSLRINGMYLQIKTDLARHLGKVDLALDDRQQLYARIRQRVLADPGATARMDVALPTACDFTQPPGWQLRRTLRYAFEPSSPQGPHHHE